MSLLRLLPGLPVVRLLPAPLVVAVVLAAGAAPARAEDSERRKIAQERTAIEARHAARERECRDRFVVTSCVEDAKRERRQGLDALRARQIKLDEHERRERAAARNAELTAKATDDARRERERAARGAASAPTAREPAFRLHAPRRAASAADRQPGEAHDQPLPAAKRLGLKPTQRGSAAERREREQQSRASYEARQQQAAEHRRDVEEKASKRLRNRPPAAPLPVPGASAPR